MKNEIGFEDANDSVCCRIVEWDWDAFQVAIFASDGKLIARSASRLNTEQVLDFIVEVAQERNALPQFDLRRKGSSKPGETEYPPPPCAGRL